MQRLVTVLAALGFSLAAANARAESDHPFRPPAVPLVTFDPYLSVWSRSDKLTDETTTHWTRKPHPLVSLIRVDGKCYRLMGSEPADLPAFPQKSLSVQPTRTVYDFEDGHVHVTLTFMTPALPNDLDALTMPLSYVTWKVQSEDGAKHTVSLYFSASGLLTVESPKQKVEWSRQPIGDLTALRIGSVEQRFLSPAGDDTRIDWGYLHIAAPAAQTTASAGANDALERGFADSGSIPHEIDPHQPRKANDQQPVVAFTFDLGQVDDEPVTRHVTVAYDEIWSIELMGRRLRPYWRRNNTQPADMLQTAERSYARLTDECAAFDKDLMADMTTVGGAQYAQMAALAYRQCLAGCGIAADSQGKPLLFTKENTSNGDIATVDVIFPMDPIFVFLSPTLAKASLVSVLNYGASSYWKYPCAPHDLGTYPIANGRDDGGEAMPVEESGNMLILLDAIAHDDGNADFCTPWWPALTQWAGYLEQFGLDPENQLCTDDFMGHLAHNANLSVKAIVALAAYGDLCRIRGDAANAARFAALARTDAEHWMKVADAGDHSLLAFDKPNTWSQKYNLVWDHLLGLNVFLPDLAKKETAFYLTQLQPFGLPLDSRTHLTKSDWTMWSATLADNPADFERLISPLYDYLDQTTAREPLADSYETDNIDSGGMHARPVVGGLFIKMLSDPVIWKKWSDRDTAKMTDWAPQLPRPTFTPVVPTSQQDPAIWRYTIDKPAETWTEVDFDDSGWKSGPGIFGNHTARGIPERTNWKTDDIWLRRKITLPNGDLSNIEFLVYHDEDVQIYVDGVAAAEEPGFHDEYEPLDISGPALALLKPGATVTLAVHCRQTIGGQGIDVGIVKPAD